MELIGLLRVLAPDIFWFIGATIVILFVAWAVRHALSVEAGRQSYTAVVSARRSVRRFAMAVWLIVGALLLWHVLSVTWSLRIPRSDVDATGVYRQMDGLTQGNPR